MKKKRDELWALFKRRNGESARRGIRGTRNEFPFAKNFLILKIPAFEDFPFQRFPVLKILRSPLRRSPFADSPDPFLILKIAMHDLRETSWITPPLFKWPFEVQTNDISLSVLGKNKGQILFKIAISAKGNSLQMISNTERAMYR